MNFLKTLTDMADSDEGELKLKLVAKLLFAGYVVCFVFSVVLFFCLVVIIALSSMPEETFPVHPLIVFVAMMFFLIGVFVFSGAESLILEDILPHARNIRRKYDA